MLRLLRTASTALGFFLRLLVDFWMEKKKKVELGGDGDGVDLAEAISGGPSALSGILYVHILEQVQVGED